MATRPSEPPYALKLIHHAQQKVSLSFCLPRPYSPPPMLPFSLFRSSLLLLVSSSRVSRPVRLGTKVIRFARFAECLRRLAERVRFRSCRCKYLDDPSDPFTDDLLSRNLSPPPHLPPPPLPPLLLGRAARRDTRKIPHRSFAPRSKRGRSHRGIRGNPPCGPAHSLPSFSVPREGDRASIVTLVKFHGGPDGAPVPFRKGSNRMFLSLAS